MTRSSILACLLAGLSCWTVGLSPSQGATSATPGQDLAAKPSSQPFQGRLSLPDSGRGRPRNVILFIGDGMGYGQIAAARIRTVGPDGRLAMDQMPVTGVATTFSANNLIPDSAACGTALACGIKTANGVIGQNETGRYQSILEAAQAKGMRTGLVVTKNLTDATPATFAAHVPTRKMEPTIARQILASAPGGQGRPCHRTFCL
jgi:alkaline phosphatase